MSNYSGSRSLPAVENGQVLTDCNFTQYEPDTAIFEGVAGLTFQNCNLTNCTVPADADVIGCNVTQVSRCSHLHPELPITQCAEDCDHVVDTDILEVDGEVVETIYHYEDKVL